jgi:hypothetical protein
MAETPSQDDDGQHDSTADQPLNKAGAGNSSDAVFQPPPRRSMPERRYW